MTVSAEQLLILCAIGAFVGFVLGFEKRLRNRWMDIDIYEKERDGRGSEDSHS